MADEITTADETTTADEISKVYEFADAERDVTTRWVDAGVFGARPDDREGRYVIMMPLPNVTGALHMGHAMDNVMQDLLVRWHRMMGDNSLWQPGTDHAGIATQAVVEKRLKELEGKTRHDVGREGLVERIWQWTDVCQKRIVAQQQRMGCSCDWSRRRFTMDAVCRAAVRETFFRLFSDGLIFRGHRLVNWDCFLQTAVSDDEIVVENVQGHFWHLRYPVVDPKPGEPTHVTVATTRPETMLGDTAVACHPDPDGELRRQIEATRVKLTTASKKDAPELQAQLATLEERLATVGPLLVKLRDMARDGRQIMLPLQNRPIPLVTDEWAKPELGSGCVKITPGHDPNDYDVWTRHKDHVGVVNILNADGTLNEAAGAYRGLQIMAAREKVVADLTALGLVERTEDREIPIGHSDRSKTPIEPWLSKQWFVRMGDVDGGLVMGRGTPGEFRSPGLAQAAMDAVEGTWTTSTGRRLTFHPDADRYAGTYLSWLREKRDWCISRQLWWGHRIPIWLRVVESSELDAALAALPEDEGLFTWICDADGVFHRPGASTLAGAPGPLEVQVCVRNEETEERLAGTLADLGHVQDPDVLDTWFSSALWPFSTLGWPDPAKARIDEGQTPLGAVDGRPDSLSYYYPGSCLVTGRDIITLWVARMFIMGLYNLGEVPFTDCFIHANIQDGKGERMSKSKGNGIDPVDIIDRYGADALRYVLCDMQSGTQDIRLPVQAISPFTGESIDLATAKHGRSIFTYICPHSGKEFDVLGTIPELPGAPLVSDRFDVGRAFCTKLWNAARFAFMNLGEHSFTPVRPEHLEDEDRWILSRLDGVVEAVSAHLGAYNPSAAIGAARDFFWGDLCDWYIELIKPRLRDEEGAPVVRTVLSLVLDQVFRLFHPFVPFITETLWKRLNEQVPVRGLDEPIEGAELLAGALWPPRRPAWRDGAVEGRFALMQDVVRGIRDVRARYGVAPRAPLAASVRADGAPAAALAGLAHHIEGLCALTGLAVSPAPERTATTATVVLGDVEIFVEGVLDPEKERARLEKQLAQLRKNLEAAERKLGNPSFVDRAPAEVVATERQRVAEAKAQMAAVEEGLRALGN